MSAFSRYTQGLPSPNLRDVPRPVLSPRAYTTAEWVFILACLGWMVRCWRKVYCLEDC